MFILLHEKKFILNRPKTVMEFWTGWFDHWGQKHHSTLSPQAYNATLRKIISENSSVNQYMFWSGSKIKRTFFFKM